MQHMTDRWLQVNTVSKSFGEVRALTNFSCSVQASEVVGIIGPNGAGKTTLFNVITGFVRPEGGTVSFLGLDLLRMRPHLIPRAGMARTFQDLRLIRRLTVLDNVALCRKAQTGENPASALLRWREVSRQEILNRDAAASLLAEVGLSSQQSDPADALSYGQQKLLTLACCLATDADLLLLDEPVAGIAPQMIQRVLSVIQHIRERGKSVLLIEHNMDAVMQVCDRVIFMDAGEAVCIGTPDQVRNDPRVIEAYME